MDVSWILDELIDWLPGNKMSILTENLPEFVFLGGSIYKSIEMVYSDFDIYQDEQLDGLFDYRRRHEIGFGMRGVKVPTLYLGVGGQGVEVSGEYNGVKYCHVVNLEGFFESLPIN